MTLQDNKIRSVFPPLKWAGGKRWLVQNHSDIFPKIFNRYIEPFAGSAAVFFHIAPQNAVLADTNRNLIESYIALRDCWEKVVHHLLIHESKHSSEYYYYIRASKPRTIATRAAKFIYLNRTCFNGIYRVNKLGEFNVPKGSKESVILKTDDFESISKILQKAELLISDFEPIIESAKAGDFLFIDPPYTVMHSTNGFIKYNEILFSWKDQLRLADCIERACQRNVNVISTNADHPSLRMIYKGKLRIRSLERNSFIAGSAKYRMPVKELLISSL